MQNDRVGDYRKAILPFAVLQLLAALARLEALWTK